MILDANILLYARNSADPHHEAARGWLESALNGDTRIGFPWWTLAAFLRIATNPRAFPDPLPPSVAWRQIEDWLDAPRAWSRSRPCVTARSSVDWFAVTMCKVR